MSRGAVHAVGRVVAGAVAATGCAATPVPSVLPALPWTATAAATAPTGAPMPPQAREESGEGAASFVRYYYASLNAAYVARDSGRLAGLTDPACVTCRRYADDIAAMIGNGHHLRTDSFAVVSADAPPVENGRTVVDLVYSSLGPVEYTDSGAVLLRRPAFTQTVVVTVARRGDRWVVTRVALP